MNVMTSGNRTESYWGNTDYREVLKRIEEIGPLLDANADGDEKNGELSVASIEALKPLRISHILVPEELDGAQLRPSEAIQLLSAISYYSGAAGWVSMVHAAIGAMSGAFLPKSASDRLFAPGSDNRFSGQGAPLGMLKKVEGGYLLTGKWSYGSGFSHATWSHSACFIDDGSGKPAKDAAGNPVIVCAHAPIAEHGRLGNWDVLGLGGTGSIDYDAEDVFVPEDLVFGFVPAKPLRMKELFSLGPVGIAAIGHTSWAIGASRRMLDEIAGYASSKTGRAGLLGESEKFWFDYGRAEARVRSANAFALEVWREIEDSVEHGQTPSTRQVSLIHLAKSEVHEAAELAVNFGYRAGGGASLRAGTMQRVFREVMVAVNHFTISPAIVAAAGRETGGLWTDRTWQFYDLIKSA